jgi:hypothetical protein
MKRIGVITAAFLFAYTIGFVQTSPILARNNTKNPNRIEKKNERKASRKLNLSMVNEASKNNFNTDYADVSDVKWVKSINFDEASFNQSGREVKAFYDKEGQLVGTTTHLKLTDLPVKCQNAIERTYKDCAVGSIIYFNDNQVQNPDLLLNDIKVTNTNSYYIEMSKGSNKFVVQATPGGDVYFFKNL